MVRLEVGAAAEKEKRSGNPLSDDGGNGGDGYCDIVSVNVNRVKAVRVKVIVVNNVCHFGIVCDSEKKWKRKSLVSDFGGCTKETVMYYMRVDYDFVLTTSCASFQFLLKNYS